jgi:4-methylaminobutanoate oxidase (formaldehyde-forming)
MVVDGCWQQTRTAAWLKEQIRPAEHAVFTDVTSAYSILSVMGPNSRALLNTLTNADLSNAAFPFGTTREIELAQVYARATRMTYVGELGWELYIPTEYAQHIYDAIVEAGQAFNLKHCGYHALNSLRIEKAYRHWGHDMSDEETPLEAGVGFAVKFDKGAFNGRERLVKQKTEGVKKRLVQFALRDPHPLLYHNEPIWRNGEIVGSLTSGMYGHTLGAAIGLGYINHTEPITAEWVNAGEYEIEVATERFPARASWKPMYDPEGLKIRG